MGVCPRGARGAGSLPAFAASAFAALAFAALVFASSPIALGAGAGALGAGAGALGAGAGGADPCAPAPPIASPARRFAASRCLFDGCLFVLGSSWRKGSVGMCALSPKESVFPTPWPLVAVQHARRNRAGGLQTLAHLNACHCLLDSFSPESSESTGAVLSASVDVGGVGLHGLGRWREGSQGKPNGPDAMRCKLSSRPGPKPKRLPPAGGEQCQASARTCINPA